MLLAGLAQKTDRYPLTREKRRTIATAAALHDIGKMEICEDLLHKEGPLTEAERVTLQSHTLLGAQMLEEQPEAGTTPLPARRTTSAAGTMSGTTAAAIRTACRGSRSPSKHRWWAWRTCTSGW